MEKLEVSIAKAFSIRKQIKNAIEAIGLHNLQVYYTANKEVIADSPNTDVSFNIDEFIKNSQTEKIKVFDNKTYTEIVDELETLMDELEKLNMTIESASTEQRVLLTQKTAAETKLQMVNALIEAERSFVPTVEGSVTKTVSVSDNGTKEIAEYKRNVYTVSRYSKNDKLLEREKELKKEINSIKDKIIYLDHTTKIDVSFLSDTWI